MFRHQKIEEFTKKIPLIRAFLKLLKRGLFKVTSFSGSKDYWIERYERGGNSGPGSYSKLAQFKAEVLNEFFMAKGITSVIEYGCGDGNQLRLAAFPNYLGFDVSPKAINICKGIFRGDSSKNFKLIGDYNYERADLTLSIDVIYHLVEDQVFESYMKRLFDSSDKYVIVYSTDYEERPSDAAPHVRHRNATEWIKKNCPSWQLIQQIPNKYPFHRDFNEGSNADFYFYQKLGNQNEN